MMCGGEEPLVAMIDRPEVEQGVATVVQRALARRTTSGPVQFPGNNLSIQFSRSNPLRILRDEFQDAVHSREPNGAHPESAPGPAGGTRIFGPFVRGSLIHGATVADGLFALRNYTAKRHPSPFAPSTCGSWTLLIVRVR